MPPAEREAYASATLIGEIAQRAGTQTPKHPASRVFHQMGAGASNGRMTRKQLAQRHFQGEQFDRAPVEVLSIGSVLL